MLLRYGIKDMLLRQRDKKACICKPFFWAVAEYAVTRGSSIPKEGFFMTTAQEEKPIQLTIPHVIYSDQKISCTAKMILAEILNLMKVNRQHCWASNNHFADMFGITRREAIYHFQQLEKQGWIISKRFNGCEIEYCNLKDRGWHRHIVAGEPLSNILDSLVQKRTSLVQYRTSLVQKTYNPSTMVGTINNNNENNNEIKVNQKKIEKIKKEIRKKIKGF